MRSGWVLPLMMFSATAAAQPAPTPDVSPEADPAVVVTGKRDEPPVPEGRAVHRVGAADLRLRQPRSAPDALRFVPGVYLQQTAHGQGSVVCRGQTGQRVLTQFDDFRLNNALFRQGPNQYFFTVDVRTIEAIDVVRGSASVELGADALSCAVLVVPRDPTVDGQREWAFQPRAFARHATADDELGGRLELDAQLGRATGVLLGVGYRDVGQLESAGSVGHLVDEEKSELPFFEKQVPRFEADGRTQMGTGFEELTGDVRAVHYLTPDDVLTVAAYLYRQFDAPRTDQCPAPEASDDDCLTFKEQFRTHVYATARLKPGFQGLHRLDLGLSYQRQHELREREQPRLNAVNGGRDDIDVYEARARAVTARLELSERWRLKVDYGADGTWEPVDSAAWTTLTRIDVTRKKTRGQYLDGSWRAQGGVFVAPSFDFDRTLTLRTGARGAWAAVSAPADPASETRAVDQSWFTVVGNAGVEYRPWSFAELVFNVEQGFRPPTLDDMTGRQPTGRGFQLENPDLVPEQSVTFELGTRWFFGRWLEAEAWAYHQLQYDVMERRLADCPPTDRECRGARVAVQLVNVPGTSVYQGVEGVLRSQPGWGVHAQAVASYAFGESDSPIAGDDRRVPQSRVPPLNGAVEIDKRFGDSPVYLGAAYRWALDQTRLSVGDEADARIPFGGTPGHHVFDLRASVQLPEALQLVVILENLGDSPYRTHGSSINGPGRGVLMSLEVAP